MGCSISVFKRFCRRLSRSKKQDRWVRDEGRRLLPDEPQKRPRFGEIPKRIELKVIEDIVQQDLPRRLAAGVRSESNLYDEIHQRMIAQIYPPHLAALYATETENNQNESAKRQVSSCPESACAGTITVKPSTGKAKRKKKAKTLISPSDELEVQQMIADFKRQMEEEGDVIADVQVASSSSHQFIRRYDVVVHSCKSTDAPWMKMCGS